MRTTGLTTAASFPDTPSFTPPVEAVRFARVSFTYADALTPALREVSLQVRQGEMVVVMGASGAGKSTLAKCMNRVTPAFQTGRLQGEIQLFGRRLVNEKVGELAGTVGMVFQDFEAQLFSTTVRDEIVFGMEQLGVDPAEMQCRLSEVLAQVGLTGFESRDPTTLSGGEKQRLAIATALALRPQLLVLDEPTTDLDPQGRQDIFALLRRLRTEGYTLIVVEHDISSTIDADQVLLLSGGQIVAAGPPHQLLPQVELITRSGVRPRDIDRLFQTLGINECPRDVEGAGQALQERGVTLASPEREEKLTSGRRIRPCSSSYENGPAPEASPFLRLQSLTHFYPDSISPTICDVTLTVREGEFIALLGQNGSGKTTLAKHCSGLLTPSRGRVLLRERELHQVPLHQLAQEVSYVFQNPDHQLFAATVEEEVAFGPRNVGLSEGEVQARVRDALAAVGLQGVGDRDPFLLDKGERQRLAVAAVLALRPRVLILDEPTTGLDYHEQRTMMGLLRRLHRIGHTIIIITHVPWVAVEYAERAWLMAQGRLLWDGPVRELCTRQDLCAQAAFRPPDITLLGLRFGAAPLSVEEFARWLCKKPVQPQLLQHEDT